MKYELQGDKQGGLGDKQKPGQGGVHQPGQQKPGQREDIKQPGQKPDKGGFDQEKR